MLFVCHSKILHKHCLQFLLGVKMAPRETENNAYAKFGVTNKEHYGMLGYFLEWSILLIYNKVFVNLLQKHDRYYPNTRARMDRKSCLRI